MDEPKSSSVDFIACDDLLQGAESDACVVIGGNERSNPDGPDYSKLPDIVWVNIMDYLSLSDKYRLSLTCTTLYESFFHPSLWHTMKIQLKGGFKSARVAGKVLADAQRHCEESSEFIKKDIKLVETFGHLFQDLTVVIDGYWWGYPDLWHELLSILSTNCRLECLSLNIKSMAKPLTWVNQSVDIMKELQHFVTLVSNSSRLKSFQLVSWPHDFRISSNREMTIYGALLSNKNLEQLTTLRLFWVKETSWTSTSVQLPSPEQSIEIVSHFRNLSQLGLRSPMLSEKLLLTLASGGRAQLQKLQILLTYSVHNIHMHLPVISSRTWICLQQACPRLEVECTVLSRIPEIDLAFFLRPEIPLSVINYMKYSHCNASVISSLTANFSKTLQRFVCYGEADDVDTELTDMVEKSPMLRTFVYWGVISSSTVKAIASLRGSNWFRFEILRENIDTIEGQIYYAPDAVVALDQDGRYQLVKVLKQQQAYEAEEFREESLEELSGIVSFVIGYKWKPFDKEGDLETSVADDANARWLRHHLNNRVLH